MNQKHLSQEYVQKRVRSLAKLSTLPMIAVKVMELVENPQTSAASLARIISNDQIMAARILKLANSAYYGFPRKISTLNLAIVVLGFNALRDLVLSISVIDQFAVQDFEEFELEQFWRHALMVGHGARILSRYFNYPVAGEVFVAGLLHDIGYTIMLQHFPEEFRTVTRLTREKDMPFHEAEKQELGYSHADVGAWLAEGWNLPDKLVRAIRYHHSPQKNLQNKDLVNIIFLADQICYSIGEGSGIENNNARSPEEIEQKMQEFFPRNGYPLSFFQDKFRQESDKLWEFLDILNKKELLE